MKEILIGVFKESFYVSLLLSSLVNIVSLGIYYGLKFLKL